MGKEHFIWIDWMKVLAMYLIIAGHCSVPGNLYIYVFSVPSFFILSGFLFKKEPWNLFIKKTFWNYCVPMLILLLINVIYKAIINGWGFLPIIKVILRSMAGYQGENYAYGGLGALWFVYTLIVCRLILQLIFHTSHQSTILFFTIVVFLFVCVLYNHHEVSPYFQYNSIVNTLLAFPFFAIGFLLSSFKERICTLPISLITTLLFCLSIILIYVSGNINGLVYLYTCSYGYYLVLCLVGGVAGSYFLLYLSRMCEILFGTRKAIEVLGQGTIIILGLHIIIMSWLTELRSAFLSPNNRYDLYLLSIVILSVFIPINIFCKRLFPILCGKYRI